MKSNLNSDSVPPVLFPFALKLGDGHPSHMVLLIQEIQSQLRCCFGDSSIVVQSLARGTVIAEPSSMLPYSYLIRSLARAGYRSALKTGSLLHKLEAVRVNLNPSWVAPKRLRVLLLELTTVGPPGPESAAPTHQCDTSSGVQASAGCDGSQVAPASGAPAERYLALVDGTDDSVPRKQGPSPREKFEAYLASQGLLEEVTREPHWNLIWYFVADYVDRVLGTAHWRE
jgi:hypothetical protein